MSKDKKIYDQIYAGKYKKMPEKKLKEYGHTNEGKLCYGLIEELKPSSLLDVGCGHNELVLDMRRILGVECVGVDFSCPSADHVCPAENMPFEDKQFDLVTSFDMFEHIPVPEVERTIAEMARVGKRFVYAIAQFQVGSGLHVTLKNTKWWTDRIEKHGGKIIKSEKFRKDNEKATDVLLVGEYVTRK
jgi:ubiquinone/menaquinone biosynthesis C-methylase UbiE